MTFRFPFLGVMILALLFSPQANSLSPPSPLKPTFASIWGYCCGSVGQGVGLDSQGNVYVAVNALGLFLLKFDSGGRVLRAENWQNGGSNFIGAQSLSVDPDGNMYLTVVDSDTPPYEGGFLKFNASGNLVMNIGLTRQPGAFAFDSFGNIYIASQGSFPGPVYGAYLLKLNSTGGAVWERGLRTNSSVNETDEGSGGVAVDRQGNVYYTGCVNCGFHVGDLFVVKFNPSGDLLWQRTWGGINDDFGSGIAIDVSGNVYVTGGADFNQGLGQTLSTLSSRYCPHSPCASRMLLLKLNSTGSLLWSRTWGEGFPFEAGSSIALDNLSNVYVAGTAFGIPLYSDPRYFVNNAVFLVKMSPSGNFLGQMTWGSEQGNLNEVGYTTGLAINSRGDAFITGAVDGLPPYNTWYCCNRTVGFPFYSLVSSSLNVTIVNDQVSLRTGLRGPGFLFPLQNGTYSSDRSNAFLLSYDTNRLNVSPSSPSAFPDLFPFLVGGAAVATAVLILLAVRRASRKPKSATQF